MNLVAYPAAQTMTLKEITDLLNVRHNNAMRTVAEMAQDPAFGMITQIEYSSPMPNGGFRVIETYQLNKRQSIAVSARLNTALLMRIIDRWQELEAQQVAQASAKPRELSRMDLIQIAMEAEQERLLLAAKVEEMKPSVAALERLTKADGSMCITDAAKQLQTTPKKLFALLSVEGWIYRRQGTSWIAYQEKIQAGLLEHKLTVIERTDGTEKTVSQVRITPKGIAKAGKMLESLTVVA